MTQSFRLFFYLFYIYVCAINVEGHVTFLYKGSMCLDTYIYYVYVEVYVNLQVDVMKNFIFTAFSKRTMTLIMSRGKSDVRNLVSEHVVEYNSVMSLSLPHLCRSVFIVVKCATLMNMSLCDAYELLSFLEILYRAIRVYLWCAFASNPIVVIIGRMSTLT